MISQLCLFLTLATLLMTLGVIHSVTITASADCDAAHFVLDCLHQHVWPGFVTLSEGSRNKGNLT